MTDVRKVRLFDPTAEPKVLGVTLAPRPGTIRGLRAGILDNGKHNAGFLMSAVIERLQATHGVGEMVRREKPVAGPPSPQVVDDLSTCGFALVGSSD